MACGDCARRKEKAKQIWAKHKQANAPKGEIRGGIGQKITSTGTINARVHVTRR